MTAAVKIALLVEDEPLIAMIAGDMLSDLGYVVLEARTKSEALAVLAVEDGITLLFTDIDLADRSSGTELAFDFSRRCPGMQIIVTSGRFRPAALPPGALFLPKPYSDHDLAKAACPPTGARRQRNSWNSPSNNPRAA